MTVEEAEKILGVESKMSYDEVLRVRPQPTTLLTRVTAAAEVAAAARRQAFRHLGI